jgi:hypothetical protein
VGHQLDIALPVLAGERKAATLTPGERQVSRGDPWVSPSPVSTPGGPPKSLKGDAAAWWLILGPH